VGTYSVARRLSQRGVTSVQFLLASGLGLLLFLAFANVVVVQYGRGAIRSALDQGVRVASVTGSVTECEARIEQVLDQLLGGVMGESVVARCEKGGATAVATAEARFDSWTPMSPDFSVSLSATSVIETIP
jgi:hypothetical protein